MKMFTAELHWTDDEIDEHWNALYQHFESVLVQHLWMPPELIEHPGLCTCGWTGSRNTHSRHVAHILAARNLLVPKLEPRYRWVEMKPMKPMKPMSAE